MSPGSGQVLVDTHLLIWASEGSPRLPERAATVLLDAAPVFSAAAIWEIAIKFARHRPDFDTDPWVMRQALLEVGFEELPIAGHHAAEVARLPSHHGDPFDRLMIAQARVEGLPFLTADAPLAAYGAPVELV